MTAVTSDEAFLSWGWRVPFLLSGVLVIVGLWIRLTISESPVFAEVEAKQRKDRAPIVDVLRLYPKRVLLAIGARVGVDVAFHTFVLFVTTYVVTYLELPRSYALNAVLLAAACQLVFIPFFGALSDRIGRRPVYLAGAAGAVVWIFAFFPLLDTKSFGLIVVAVVVALVLHAAMYGPQSSFIAEMFPPRSDTAAPPWATRWRESSVARSRRSSRLPCSTGTTARSLSRSTSLPSCSSRSRV